MAENQNFDDIANGTNFNENDEQYLSFQVGHEDYAVSITSVVEIKAWSKPTRLPNVPSYMLGIINVRGVILPIIDLKGRFGLGNTEGSDKKVIVFIMCGNRTLGILVDAVSDIVRVNPSMVQDPPEVEGELKKEFIKGLVGASGKMLVLLNIDTLFSDQELGNLNLENAA